MAQYATLKAAINAVIKANGQKEITGTVLNEVLTSMVNSLGANYQFAGVATPSTNPGTPDQNVFYIAGQGGTYTNFNNIAIPNGISFLIWNGSWSSQTVLSGDGSVFDISAYKATGGTLATFADLSAALGADGANVPVAFRKGGMSVKFIQGSAPSSDNKYHQFRCISNEFTTNVIQWKEMMSLSYNCGEIYADNVLLLNTTTWDIRDSVVGKFIPVKGGQRYSISSEEYSSIVAFLTTADVSQAPSYASGCTRLALSAGDKTLGIVPNDAQYLYISEYFNNAKHIPSSVLIDGFDYIKKNVANVGEASNIDINEAYNGNESLERIPLYVSDAAGTLIKSGITSSILFEITAVDMLKVTHSNSIIICYLNDYPTIIRNGNIADVLISRVGYTQSSPFPVAGVTAPTNCKYCLISETINGSDWGASSIKVNGYDIFNSLKKNLNEISSALNDKVIMLTGSGIVSNNDNFNSIVQELYINPDIKNFALSSIVTGIVRRSYLIGGKYYNGVTLNSSSSTIVSIYKAYSSQLEAENNLNQFIVNYFGYIAMVNWNKMSANTERSFAVTLNNDVTDINKMPFINKFVYDDELYFNKQKFIPNVDKLNEPRALRIVGDTKTNDGNYIVNSVAYPDGSIIACRKGRVVKIELDGTEVTLLSITGSTDWRLCWMDSQENVYVSPHASAERSSMASSDRGLYKLEKGDYTFTKVIDWYNSEVQDNDCIWTMTEDVDGNLYAGVYSHTVRHRPVIYKSTDGGDTWSVIFDFLTLNANGHHVHCIEYNKYNNALYCIVGEINTIFKSVDGGTSWIDLQIRCEIDKGTTLFAVPDGLLIGSDSAYDCIISKLSSDDKCIRTVGRMWANTVFGIRQSDVTGWIYAYTKIDSSVNNTDYYPPITVISGSTTLQEWKDGNPAHLAEWEAYNQRMSSYYTGDAIRPRHCAILVSKDNGESWEIFCSLDTTSAGGYGFITIGQFRNGECLAGYIGSNNQFSRPLIVSDGDHLYTDNGLDLSDSIYGKTLSPESSYLSDRRLMHKVNADDFLFNGNGWGSINFITVNNNNVIQWNNGGTSYVIPIHPNWQNIGIKATASNASVVTFVNSLNNIHNWAAVDVNLTLGRVVVTAGNTSDEDIPNDAKYIIVSVEEGGNSLLPDCLYINGVDILEGVLSIVSLIRAKGDNDNAYTSIGKDQAGAEQAMCVAVGYQNMKNNSGVKNVTVGNQNMRDTTGEENTSVGYHSLCRNTSGARNTAVGSEAADDNTTGQGNTAVGAYALQRNNDGYYNTVVGFEALGGNSDSYVGNRSNQHNVAVGARSLRKGTSASNNIAIGFKAMENNTETNGSIVIGNQVDATKDNQMILGSPSITEVIIAGKKVIFHQDGSVTWEALS